MGLGKLTSAGARARRLQVPCAWLCAAAAAACAPGREANVAPMSAPSSGAAAPPAGAAAPEPPVDLDPGAALERGPGDGEILVRTSVLRGHPVGVHLGPLFAMWPGWRSTLRAIARDPILDLDWIDVVGPSDPAGERMLAHLADGAADAALDGRLLALEARSAEPAGSHVDGHVPAAAARLDGVLRIVFHPQPRFAAAAGTARSLALSHLLARARIQATEPDPLEAIRLDIPRPHDAVRLLPASLRRIRARIRALAGGDADGSADGDCDSAEEASQAAAALRETVARQNSPLVRMLTRGLLDAIAVTADGSVVKIRVHATRDQLEAVMSLVAAVAPTDS